VHDIADVRLDLEEERNPSSSPAAARPELVRARAGRWIERAAWVGLLAALGALTAWLAWTRPPIAAAPAVEIAIYPPPGTTFVRSAGGPWPIVSPDGSKVAFVALSQTDQQLWIRSLDSTVARPLSGTEGAFRPFWSPDSQSIAFFANGEIRRIDLASRAVRVLGEARFSGGLSGTWGEDAIVFSGALGGLRRLPLGGGSSSVVVAGSELATPTFLSDGRRFLYLAARNDQTTFEVCLGSVAGGEHRCVPGPMSPVRFAPSGHLVFVRDGILQAQRFDVGRLQFGGEAIRLADTAIDLENWYQAPPFSLSPDGVLAFYPRPPARYAWFDRSGRQLDVLPITGGTPAVSPDGLHVVAARRDPRTLTTDLWLFDRARGTETRFTLTPTTEVQPTFSRDGAHVVYSVLGEGFFQKPVTGGAETRLLDVDGGSPDWSADGRFVVYQAQTAETGFDLWAVALSGDRKPFPVAQSPHGEREGAFSPDVRWLAYDSTETGRREVWVQPFPPTGARWQISTAGGVSPRWRGDGRELFYVAADGRLTAVPITAGAGFQWGAPRALFETPFRSGTYAPLQVSDDGQRFLMQKAPDTAEESPITVIVNWTARLPRP
jgi:Tol biopolymer transport system component